MKFEFLSLIVNTFQLLKTNYFVGFKSEKKEEQLLNFGQNKE